MMEKTDPPYPTLESIGEGRLETISSARGGNQWRRYLPLLICILVIPVLTRDATAALSVNPPILISESTSTRAVAVESLTLMPEPFALISPYGGSGQRTRVMVFAMNLNLQPGEDLSVISADAEDAAHRHYALTVESIRPVPSYEWLSAVVFKLNDDLGDVGDVLVSVSYRSVMSNRVRIGIGHIGGGPADDLGAVPTPAPPYTISGRLTGSGGQGLSGVSITLSGAQIGTVVTGEGGFYSFTVNKVGDYTLTPASNPYYTFVPQIFSNLHLNQTANFAGTLRYYTVSGRLTVGPNAASGVVVPLSGSQTATATTNSNGEYSFSLPAGGNYTITPVTNAYYSFTSSESFTDLRMNQTADFAGILRFYTVSGWAQLTHDPAPFLEIQISGSQSTAVTTDANGRYSISLPAGGNYTLTPSSVRYYYFDPPSWFLADLTSDQNNRFFFGRRQLFMISGRLVNQEGNGLAGLTVNLGGAEQRTTVTGESGDYQFPSVLAGYNYTVTPPSTASYKFTGQNVIELPNDYTLDFIGLRRLLLSGRVKDQNGNGIIGVTVTMAGTESASTITAADGSYSFTATATGNYTVTPSIGQGWYTFAPASGQFNNLASAHTTDFTATLALVPDPSYVLEFDGQPKTVDYGNFWQEGVNLGHFFWEFWAMPGSNAGATYMLSDGYGGAHALLFGVGSFNTSESNRYELLGNIFDGVRFDNYFGSDVGPAIGEWGHFAVGWDGQNIITYYNGVPVGKTPFAGPRRTPGVGGGGGRLLIGGSDHSNFNGRIAQVRGYEDANPREDLPGGVESSFAPQTVFGVGGSMLSYYFRSAPIVADLSRGYNGIAHEGQVRGTAAGILADCGGCPTPQFVVDSTAPNFATGAPPSPVNVPPSPAPPGGALVFDSFSRPNLTYTFGGPGGLGSTEGGSAGIRVWQTYQAPASLQPFGILNARAVLLANSTAVAWVPTGSATGNVDVRVNRYKGRWGSGIHTGLSFRVIDAGNFFFAYTADTSDTANPITVRVGYYLNHQRVDLTTGAAMPSNWTTLRVVTTNSGDLKVYIDASLVFSTTSPLLASATGAGLYNNSSGLGLVNRWDNFTVFNAP